jgi:phospholipase/carboxylesterase
MDDALPETLRVLQAVGGASWSAEAGTAPVVAILLHGYGANEHDLTSLVSELALELPWAALRAPLEMGNGGAAWFAITAPGDPAPEPVAAATDAIWAWIDEFAPTARVVPIGFSQGGFMATQLLRTRPERVLAPVVLAGFVAGTAQVADDRLAAERPAMFWGRGSVDGVITQDAVARTAAFLPAHSTLTERVYPGLGHGISAQEVADVREFLAAQLG